MSGSARSSCRARGGPAVFGPRAQCVSATVSATSLDSYLLLLNATNRWNLNVRQICGHKDREKVQREDLQATVRGPPLNRDFSHVSAIFIP